jgi:hypothetical protein
MPTAVQDTGTGSTLIATTSNAFLPKIRSMTINGEEIAVIDTTHLGTTGTMTAMLGDLKTRVTIEAEGDYNPSLTYPTGVSETWTWTGPIPAGGTTGATIAFTGSLVSHGAVVPLEDKMTTTFRIEALGAATRVSAS